MLMDNSIGTRANQPLEGQGTGVHVFALQHTNVML